MNWFWTVSIVDLNFYYYILCFIGIVKVTCRWIAIILLHSNAKKMVVLAFYRCIKTYKNIQTHTYTHKTIEQYKHINRGWLLWSRNASSWQCTADTEKTLNCGHYCLSFNCLYRISSPHIWGDIKIKINFYSSMWDVV